MTYNVSSGTLNPTIPYHTSSEMHHMSECEFLVGSAVAEKCVFRLDASATATWLAGWVACCHTPVLYENG